MNTPKEIVADWANTCEALALEYWQDNSDQDASEYAHECAYSSQWAIYCYKAWDLVSAARIMRLSDFAQAESDLVELGFGSEVLDQTVTQLACQLTYNEILTQINEQEGSEND